MLLRTESEKSIMWLDTDICQANSPIIKLPYSVLCLENTVLSFHLHWHGLIITSNAQTELCMYSLRSMLRSDLYFHKEKCAQRFKMKI